MDWQTAYHPERLASWDEIAESIRSSVTMWDVLAMYRSDLQPRGRRVPCPIHNGKDYNFSFTDKGYKCFVCGASGDVIAFVKEVCELSTRADAMKRINKDFGLGLPIGEPISATQSANLALRKAEAEKRSAERQAWEDEYHRLLDWWIELDKIKRTAEPDSDEYADAVKIIDFVNFQLEMLLCDER